MRQVLRQKSGVNLDNSIVVDGSGLSHHNLISPATMMQALQYIAQHDNELKFIEMLPLAGYNGILQYCSAGLHEIGVDGKVSEESAALQGVYNLAALSPRPAHGFPAISIWLCGAPPEDQRTRCVPLAHFESHLYKYLYQNN
ncbi:MAG: D-alanyl-D-alanine carboxypeptidase [Symbiopectobacterium sp.]